MPPIKLRNWWEKLSMNYNICNALTNIFTERKMVLLILYQSGPKIYEKCKFKPSLWKIQGYPSH